jgi:septum formation protein
MNLGTVEERNRTIARRDLRPSLRLLHAGIFPQGYSVPLILASSSSIRRAVLDAAGVEYEAIPSRVDETAIKNEHGDPEMIASKLAQAKALDVSSDRPGDWVAGSDSVVSVEGRTFDKPASRDEAADHLRFFSAKEMRLTSAVALARGEQIGWSHVETATLTVRHLSEEFIQSYLEVEWPDVGYCVGVFRLEGRGVQLFSAIDGSYFTILGMPLLPLLGALRERGLIPS